MYILLLAVAGGEDYVSLSSREVVFQPGERVQSVSVEILADVLVEGNEVFTVSLSTSAITDTVHLQQSFATVTILDGLSLHLYMQ